MAIKTYLIQYKYPDGLGWQTYDQTRVKSWAESQLGLVRKEYEGAQYRLIEK